MDYTEIADQLDEELKGRVERCAYGEKDCILWSDPSKHPDLRNNPNNIAVVDLADHPSKTEIKNDLLGYWFINEV